MRELERCLRAAALWVVDLWLVVPVLPEVLAWDEATPGRPNASPAAVRMLATVADAATDLTRARPSTERWLSVMT